uniref:G_PROTEIN_RECEP_F1_2 domain-containing protein n=1 Tax=Caenorhabditis tropicalis TaxID=1561998 RepID=A0A1I7TYB3_9PELO
MSDINAIIYSNMYTKDYDKTFIVLYVVEGLFIILANLFLTIRLFTNRQLRAQKEFVVIGACLFFDVIFGITYFSAGVYRAILLFVYEKFPLVSMWDCFATVHNQFFIIVTVMAGIVLVFTAIDRFICVFFPFHYIKLHVEYAYMLMFLPYLIVFPLWIPGAIGAYNRGSAKNFTMNCLMNQALPTDYYVLYRTIRILTTIACIFIYLPIFIKMCVTSAMLPSRTTRTNHTMIVY